ncbi:MAG: GAF domain-containing protein [Armatimonadota bacterium]|nr:GAF domain-containing protein [Armatimonadota bacterium]
MLSADALRELLELVLLTRNATSLYTLCDHALKFTGARNAMIADYSVEHGFMTLRAGIGQDWRPELLGSQINIADDASEGITAYVAATGRTFRSDDVATERLYRRLIPGTRSELASPIRDANARIRGVLNVESDEPAHFGEEAQRNLELLAVIAGIALDREDQGTREDALMQIGTALDEARTEEGLLKRVAMVTQAVLRVSAYSIFLWDEEEQAFTLRDTVGSSLLPQDAQYVAGEGATGWVCQHGEPIRISDPASDPRWRGKYVEVPAEQIASFMAAPILSGGKCMGCMRAIRKRPQNRYIENRFTEDDERLLLAIADQLGTGLEKLRSLSKLIDRERMAAWGELSAKNSHMIGNRVFALKGDLNELRFLLSEENVDRNSIKQIADSLEAGVTRLDAILHEFRDFVTATKLNLSRADINEVVKSAAKALVPATSNVVIDFDLASNLPPMTLDVEKVERAIAELVENSLHFVDKGRIAVTTRHASIADLVGAKLPTAKGDHVAITIADQGPGVEEGRKKRIFEPYQSSRPRGMGLGLSIVKGIVEAHGGKVFESGEEGKGAKFVILLPVEPDVPEERPQS